MSRRLRSGDPCWCGSEAKHKRCHGDHRALRREPVRPGEVGPVRTVPDGIARPDYVGGEPPHSAPLQIFTDPEELRALRRACAVAARVLVETAAHIAPGVTTDELDAAAHAAYLRLGAYPSTLGYGTYRKSICTSVNEVICHGIPDSRPLRDGDIVNIDVTAYIDGFHGDTSATFPVGAVGEPTAGLIHSALDAMHVGIEAVRPGRPVRDIGVAIEAFGRSRGYGVVADYGGHGIGRVFHAPPHISHVEDHRATTLMVPGMVFTVEPMLNAGGPDHDEWDDDWTIACVDGLPSAQFEHTVLVTETGHEILTVVAAG
ncbi:MAG: type I methionyl aminopeptidase [Acidimicrobiales bacterium]|nr:type I methionyl aminopeptidase [Acidimicrobiales bacterium]